MSLSDLSYVLTLAGRPADALVAVDRAIQILTTTDPENFNVAFTYANRGDALYELGRLAEAEQAYSDSLRLFEKGAEALHPEAAFAFHGLGKTKIAEGTPVVAVLLLKKAMKIRQQPGSDPVLLADTQLALADALWRAGNDRSDAVSLAAEARKTFAAFSRLPRERAAASWLAEHPQR